jgi:hypothetical protein
MIYFLIIIARKNHLKRALKQAGNYTMKRPENSVDKHSFCHVFPTLGNVNIFYEIACTAQSAAGLFRLFG